MHRVRRGNNLFFEVMEQQGVTHIFGNPGTTELPIMDGLLTHSGIEYVLALHENVAVGAAMGHALATGRLGVANLHGAPGLSHGLCNVINAWATRIPLVVTVGQQDTRGIHEEPVLWAPVVEMVRPITKWAYEVHRIDEMQAVLERAFQTALTPPQGPVLVSLTHDVLWDETDVPLRRPGLNRTLPRVQPPRDDDVREAVALLRNALPEARGMILVGDDVLNDGAAEAVVAFAEATGLDVYHEPLSLGINFPNRHPQFRGVLRNDREHVRQVLSQYSLIVMAGFTSTAPYLYYDDEPVYPADATYLVLTSTWHQASKLPHGHVTVVGSLRSTLSAIHQALGTGVPARAIRNTGPSDGAHRRTATGAGRLDVGAVVALLDDLLPEDAVIFNESVSNSGAIRSGLRYDPIWGRRHAAVKGGGLGYSMGMAIGHAISRRDVLAVNVIGDGSLLYYPQALWTAARYQAPVLVIILNNRGYRILKLNLDRIRGGRREPKAYPGTDINEPTVDFMHQSRAFGIDHRVVTTGDELAAAVEGALMTPDRPHVVEILLDQDG